MKLYVCDTSSLAHSPISLQSFTDGEVILPIATYEELDDLAHGKDQKAYNARQILIKIEELQEQQDSSEVILESGVKVSIVDDFEYTLSRSYNPNKPDNHILNTALYYRNTYTDDEVILVSNDRTLRSKARKFKIKTTPLLEDRVNIKESDMYYGWQEYLVSSDRINSFYSNGYLNTRKKFFPNEFVILKDEAGSNQSALAKFDAKRNTLVPLRYANYKPCDISARNVQQKFLIEALMDPSIQIVAVSASAGTGKSLLAIASGLDLVTEDKYNRLSIFKSLTVVGDEMGFMPGDYQEKLGPYMESVRDSFDFIFSSNKKETKDGKSMNNSQLDYLIESGQVELNSITFLRGRSLPNLFMIIEEAQNISPAEIKTIISRCGENTKIVLLGDPAQIDNRYLDAQTNGLTYLIEKFKGQECFASIKLIKTERSELAELAAKLL